MQSELPWIIGGVCIFFILVYAVWKYTQLTIKETFEGPSKVAVAVLMRKHDRHLLMVKTP